MLRKVTFSCAVKLKESAVRYSFYLGMTLVLNLLQISSVSTPASSANEWPGEVVTWHVFWSRDLEIQCSNGPCYTTARALGGVPSNDKL
jgi:hypothetical protein